VQRLFSTFPAGAPGGGLLLLRVAAGVAAMAQSFGLLWAPDERTILARIAAAVTCASGLSLLLGLLTPAAGALVAFLGLAFGLGWLRSAMSILAEPLSTFFLVVVALAIILLGPGAYSLDAYLFGRREIVIPGARGGGSEDGKSL
jgi:uncharacterized membrane protein YphA (DoxX/SURF4 family)